MACNHGLCLRQLILPAHRHSCPFQPETTGFSVLEMGCFLFPRKRIAAAAARSPNKTTKNRAKRNHPSSISFMEFLRLAHSILLLLTAAAAAASQQRSFDYPKAGLGTKWLNDERSSNNSVDFFDGSKVRTMLIKGSLGPRFACGFFCAGASCSSSTGSYFFGVFIVITDSASGIVMPAIGFPQLVWAANRGRPVSENATVELRRDGNLVLQDANGEPVWASGTSDLGVTGMALLESGNLVLHGGAGNNATLWQSFDHPSDVMLPGQALRAGMKLVASTSASDSTPGPYYLTMEERGLVLYASAAPNPQPYWKRTAEPATAGKSAYAEYTNGSISLFVNPPPRPGGNGMPDASIELPAIQSAQYLRLSHDGRLLLFSWESKGWSLQFDLLRSSSTNSKCNLPSACGHFGVCTDDGECSCPRSFAPLDVLRPSRGCLPRRRYQCQPKRQGFLELQGMDYFANDYSSGTRGLSLQQCKSSCRRDCSCRAVFYRNGEGAPDKSTGGICYPVTEVYSLRNSYRGPGYTSVAYIKV